MAQTRRDQVQAHVFVMTRLTTGMLRGDPDATESFTRRTTRGLIGGAVLAAVIALIVTLYGAVVGGGATSWRTDGTLILVKDDGSRVLYLAGALHPVLNDTSARLLAGDQLNVQVLSASSLAGTPRGAAVGIVGAPESLPPIARLDHAAWSACTTQPSGMLAGDRPAVSVVAGPVLGAAPPAGGRAIVATAPDRSTYLLWDGQRWRLDVAGGVLAALGYDAVPPTPLPAAVLDVLPAGADFAPPVTPNAGRPGPAFTDVPVTRIGQLFTGPAGEHYLLRDDGLVPLTDTVFELLRGDPVTQRVAYGGKPVAAAAIGPADLARWRASGRDPVTSGLPATPPAVTPVPVAQAVCVEATPGTGAPTMRVTVAPARAVTGSAPVLDAGVTAACAQADEVRIAPGTGALARGVSAGGGIDTVQYLVTDIGVKYPMSAAGARQLGYAGGGEVRLPAALLAMLPTGPLLDPAAVTVSGTAPSSAAAANTAGCQP